MGKTKTVNIGFFINVGDTVILSTIKGVDFRKINKSHFSVVKKIDDNYAYLDNGMVINSVVEKNNIYERISRKEKYKGTVSDKEKRLLVWNKTNGKCWYCGKILIMSNKGENSFIVEHVENHGNHKLENLLPSCRSCNGLKCKMNLEEFRMALEYRKNKKVIFYGETL